MRVEGKVALVTGAGSGIGAALAAALCGAGAQVILVGRRGAALLGTRATLPYPERGIIAAADVTLARDRAALRSLAERRFGRLDLLVNNAGIVPVGPLGALGDEEITETLAVNLVAPLALTRDLLPLLRIGAPSRVVNIGSMFGEIAFPLFGLYSASKFGLRGLSQALRRELARDGIGVTHAAPRATRTPASAGFDALVAPFRMRLDEPAAVAARILRGIGRDARIIYPAGPERLFAVLQDLLPRMVDRTIARQLEAAVGARRVPPARADGASSEPLRGQP